MTQSVSIPERAREIALPLMPHVEPCKGIPCTCSIEHRHIRYILAVAAEEAMHSERELCQKIVNAMLQRKALARDSAAQAGRAGVSECRQSDVETCEEILKMLKEEK